LHSSKIQQKNIISLNYALIVNYTVNGKNFNSLNSSVSIDVFYGFGPSYFDANHNGTPFISISGIPIEAGTFSYTSFLVDTTNIGLGTKQLVFEIFADEISSSRDCYGPLVFATITEYGNPGEFISGNFEGVRTKYVPIPAVTYNISCYFRVKRP
jgi:hypothetical protein